MARAIADIIKEIQAGYNPIKDAYNKQLKELDPQQQLDVQGLEQAKQNAFGDITTGANRRGMFYSGMPLEEQAKYTGSEYLPSLASLKSRYAGLRGNLREALAGVDRDMYNRAQELRQQELDRELQERLAREAAARAGGSGGGGSGGGGFSFGGGGYSGSAPANNQPQLTLRQQWQKEANAGDWDAQVALNYAGDDGRYDGPVNSQDEYNRLKNMGIRGNYYVRPSASRASTVQIPNVRYTRTGMGYVPF